MKTRVRDSSFGFGFEYAEAGQWPEQWRAVGGGAVPLAWPTAAARDRARACFSRRRSVQAALADLALLDARAGRVQP